MQIRLPKCFSFLITVVLFVWMGTPMSNAQGRKYRKVVSVVQQKPVYKQRASLSATLRGPASACQNSNVPITFKGIGGTAPYTFTYKVNNGTDQTCSTTAGKDSITLNIAVASTVKWVCKLLSVQDASNSPVALTDSLSLPVNDPPTANFFFTNDNSCAGSTITFTPDASGTYSYLWDFGDGSTSTEATPVHYYAVSGTNSTTYQVRLTVTNTVSGCMAISSPKSVIVRQGPDATLNSGSQKVTIGNLTVFKECSSASDFIFSFSNASSTNTSNTAYEINWGDNSPLFTSATAWTSLTHTYSKGSWNVTYKVTGQNGCVTTRKYIVFLGSNPAVTMGNPGNTDICANTPLTFPITRSPDNPPGTTYTVTFNDGSAPLVYDDANPLPATVTHTFTKSSCGTTSTSGSISYPNSFSAQVVATNPCGTSAVGVVPIYVSTSPTAKITLPSTSVCQNKSICITDGTLNSNEISNNGTTATCSANHKVIWTITPSTGYTLNSGATLGDDLGSANQNLWITGSSSICPTFTVAGSYHVKMKVANRCGVDEVDTVICVEPNLVPLFTLDNTSGCIPLTVKTTNTTDISKLCSTTTYQWTVGYVASNCGTTSGYTIVSGAMNSANPSFQFTNPGTYSLKLTMTNSCGSVTSAAQTITVSRPPTVSINAIANLCGPGNISPSATIASCTTSANPMTYQWDFPGGTPATATTASPGTISYSTPGTYTVSLSVKNDCAAPTVATRTFTLNEIPALTNTDLSQTVCSGFATTLVNLTSSVTSGTFTWTASATAGISGFLTAGTNTIPVQNVSTTASTPGTITYVITPKSGTCSGTPVNYVITVNPAPKITQQPVSGSVCKGGTPNAFTVAVGNTTATAMYQWYSNAVNNTTSGTLIAGETNASYTPSSTTIGTMYYYCVISLSSGGCSSLTSSAAALTVNDIPTINNQPTATQTLCVGGTLGTPLSVVVTGGAGITYQWYVNTTNSTTGGTKITGATSASYTPSVFTSVGDFYYYVEVSFSANGCGNSILSSVAEVKVVPDPVIDNQALASQTWCQSAKADTLQIKVSGGSGAFNYQWYRNTLNANTGGTVIAGAILDFYVPSTAVVGTSYYYCQVSQSTAGCFVASNTSEVIVKQASSISQQPSSSTVCKGATLSALTVTLANPVGTPSYQWYQNTVNSITGGTAITGASLSSYSPSSVTAGTTYYYCVITLSTGGCSVLTSNIAKITVNETPAIADKSQTICSNQAFLIAPNSSGADNVPVGTTYTWSTPVVSPVGAVSGISAQTTDQTNISQKLTNKTTSPATVTYTVTPKVGTCSGQSFKVVVTVNPSITVIVTRKNISCIGSGDGELHLIVSGGVPFGTGAPYQINWSGPSSFTSTATDLTNLIKGIYTLTINDAGGCPFTRNDTIVEPSDLALQLKPVSSAGCFGSANGAISSIVTGGTPPYQYTWMKNGVTISNASQVSGLSAGNYDLSVTDANGCGPKKASYTITESPELMVSLLSKKDNTCFGDKLGAISVVVSGGSPGYSYAWKGPSGYTSTLQNINQLISGAYTLVVTDQAGCTKNLLVTVGEPSKIVISATITPVTCYGANDGSLVVSLSGGMAPYDVKWSNFASGLTQDNLSPGNYTITVTDANKCQQSLVINIPDPTGFTMNPVVNHVTCYGAKNGSIALNLKAGNKAVVMKWADNGVVGSTRNNLGPGAYTVTVSDATPCTFSKTFIINEPAALVLSADVKNALDCSNTRTGSIDLSVSGGTPPYTYLWSNGNKTSKLSNLTAGNYLVTVTDSVGCSVTETYVVQRPAPLAVKLDTIINFNCTTHELKAICTAVVTGGVPPYQLKWSDGTVSGADQQTMETTKSGMFTLDVSDSRNCSLNTAFSVQIPKVGIDYQLADCDRHQYLFKALTANTGTQTYTYKWDFGDGQSSDLPLVKHEYAKTGNYRVTLVIAGASCTSQFVQDIQVASSPLLTITPEPKLCYNDSVVVHAHGAYRYRWSNGSNSDSLVIKKEGSYSVIGVTKDGCSAVYNFTASYYDRLLVELQSEKNEINSGVENLHFWIDPLPSCQYYWEFGDGSTATGADVYHVFNTLKDGFYDVAVSVTNTHGCVEKATKRMWIKAAIEVNSFSPNGDGKNDVFLKGWRIQVFNRNGVLLYDGMEGWNGKFKGEYVSNDTYYYIQYYSTDSGTKTRAGYVTIIR